MSSPAQRHVQRILAAQSHAKAVGQGTATPTATGSAYELMLAKLATDKRSLKEIKSLQAKIELKRKLLPDYAAWIAGVMQADQPAQDDVLATVMVWHIDTGDIAGALTMAAHMLNHDIKLPEHYQRDLATLLVEEIADQAGTADSTVTADQLLEVGALTQGRDMPDEVRAKLHKAIGLSLRETAPAQALDHLQQALRLNARCGVTQQIQKLTKRLAADTPTAN